MPCKHERNPTRRAWPGIGDSPESGGLEDSPGRKTPNRAGIRPLGGFRDRKVGAPPNRAGGTGWCDPDATRPSSDHRAPKGLKMSLKSQHKKEALGFRECRRYSHHCQSDIPGISANKHLYYHKNVRRPQLAPRVPRAMSDLSDLGAREPRVDQAGAPFQDFWR